MTSNQAAIYLAFLSWASALAPVWVMFVSQRASLVDMFALVFFLIMGVGASAIATGGKKRNG